MKLAGPGNRKIRPLSSASPVIGLLMLANACMGANTPALPVNPSADLLVCLARTLQLHETLLLGCEEEPAYVAMPEKVRPEHIPR